MTARVHLKCKLMHGPDEPCPTDATPWEYARADRAAREDYQAARPWLTEPSHEEFRSPDGLACLLHRGFFGQWCGYVGVPPGHPWHGQHHTEIDASVHASVHGGLNYSAPCTDEICHTPLPGESADVWWFGFDCGHCNDICPEIYEHSPGLVAIMQRLGCEYRTIEYARRNTLLLAAQAAVARTAHTTTKDQ